MAKVNEVVNRVRMEATTHGVDEQISKTKGLVNAQGELVRSSEMLTQTTEKSVKGRLSLETPLQKLENRWDKQIMLQRRLMEVENQHKQAMANQPELVGRYGNVLGKVQAQLDHVTQSTNAAALAQQKAAQSMVIPARAVTVAEAAKNAYRDLKGELVPLFGIGQQYKRQVDEIRNAQAAGIINQQQATAAIQRARVATNEQVEAFNKVNAATGKYINGTGLARHELINFSRQAQDVAVSLGSGQGFGTVLLQQGSQIADIFISSGATMRGFFGQVAAGAAFVLKPIVAIPLALATVGAAAVTAMFNFDSGQKEVQKSLLGIGKASGATRDDINKIAKESASSFGLSVNEAQEFASALAATGRVGVDEIGKVVALGKDVARIYGVDAADAAKMLAKAYADPAKGAEELNQRLGSFNAATQETIKNLQIQNNMQAAQSLLTAGVSKGVEGISATVAKSTTIWEAMGNAISNAWRAFGEGAARAAGLVEDSPVKRINDQLRETELRIEEIRQSMDFRSSAADMPGTSAGPVTDKTALEAAEAKLRDLTEQARMLKDNLAQTADEAKRVAESLANQKLVDTFLPLAKQLKEAEAASQALDQRLKDIAASGGASSKILSDMGRSLNDVQMAARLAAEAVKELQDKMAQQERRLGRREQVREQFKDTGISADIGMQLNQMKDQLAVAQAITAQERMRAQEIATTRQLLDDGRSIEEATAVAAAQRANTQAQINSGAQLTLAGLQDQFGVASAVTGQEKMRAQEIATTNNLIRQGVDAGLAARIAAQEHANAQAQINSQAQLTLAGLQDQFAVASAITGKQKMRAQEEATYNNLVRQGVDVVLAANIAEQERANTQAQINANAQNTLLTLRDQAGVVGAITGAERIAAQEQATYNKLVREGVDATIAEAVAAQEAENARAAATAAVYRQVIAVQQETALIRAQGTAWEGATKAAIAYDNAIMSGASERSAAHLREAVLIREKARSLQEQNRQLEDMVSGMRPGTSIFEPARAQMWREDIMPEWYKSERMKNVPWGLSMEQPRNQMTPKGFEELIVPLMLQQGGVAGALKQLTSKPIFGQFDFYTENPFPDVVNRLIELLPEKDQAATLQQVLEQVKTQPISLAREELIKDLTDKIEALKNSTDALNDTIEIDPLYTQGHGYIGIGYYTEGGRSSRIPLDPNTPPHVPDLPTTTPVLPPPTTQSDPIQYPIQLPVSSQLTPYTEEQLRYRREHPGTPINFANGGSFMVGGTGGTDSQYIPMRLTPGEMIDVTPPHGKANGKPTVVNNITNNFNFPPDRSYGNRRTQRQAREGYGRSVATMH